MVREVQLIGVEGIKGKGKLKKKTLVDIVKIVLMIRNVIYDTAFYEFE